MKSCAENPALIRRTGIAICATLLALVGIMAQAKEPSPSGWTQYKGKGYTLCDGLLKELRRYKYLDPLKNPNACPWAVVANYSGFTEPPWEDLDVKQHEELLFQLQRFAAIGKKNYFSGVKDKTDYGYPAPSESYSREQVQEFIASGGTLQRWRVPLPDFYPLLKNNPATAGPLNILHLRTPVTNSNEGLGQCPEIPKITSRGHVVLVNDSLTGPDPRQHMNAGGGLSSINGSALRIFKGVVHRFNAGGLDISIYRDDIPADDGSGEFCRLVYRHPNSGRK